MNERRESRIPRSLLSSNVGNRPHLLDKTNNVSGSNGAAGDRKRKAGAAGNLLGAVQEMNKRSVGSFTTASMKQMKPPDTSNPGPVFPVYNAESFGPKIQNNGPGPGEETYEEISERTGATVEDILNKRMQFKKGLKAEKKVEDLIPMVKEIRAVAWHLHSIKEKSALDAQQWKLHCEKLESASASECEAWALKESELQQHLNEQKTLLDQAQGRCSQALQDLVQAQSLITEHTASIIQLKKQINEIQERLDKLNSEVAEKEAKIKGMEEVMHHSQSYSSTLQTYNTTLQADLNNEKAKREEVTAHRDALQSQVAELNGRLTSSDERLKFDQDQLVKIREERDKAVVDVSMLRADLDSTRQERDRLLAENTKVKEDYERIRQLGGKSIETMESLTNDKATLEVQLSTQQKLIANMREELGICKEHKAMAESQSESRGAHLLELKAQLEDAVLSLEAAERRMHDGELMRRRLHNTIQELKGNIRVFCRVRPMSSLEQVGADPDIQPALDFPPSDDLLSAGIILSAPSRDGAATLSKHVFAFDRVFTPEASQDAVFEEISELVQSALDGHKVCIFAYGQTGSGKTFTMLGSEEQPGMIPRSMRQIFESSQGLRQQGWELSLQASMLEIYNEEYKDLLSSKKLSGSNKSTKEGFGSQQPSGEIKKHQVVHNPDGSTTVSELTVVDITQASQVDLLLAQAMEKRSVGCTALNEQSSRSHMVFTLRLEGVNEAKGKRVSGVLNLIDLAGSERVKDSGAAGLRMKEAQAINTSLSALGDVIVALGNKQPHIPFRNSKLTYLLQPCLGGDAKTLMFVNVAPNIQFAGESLCSLRFAAKVNACEINHRKRG